MTPVLLREDFPGSSDGKTSVYSVRHLGSIPGLGRFPGEGNGNPLPYSCLENPMDGGGWGRLNEAVEPLRNCGLYSSLLDRIRPFDYCCLNAGNQNECQKLKMLTRHLP